MVYGYSPQSYLNVASKQLTNADFTPADQDADADHAAHVTGKVCAKCGDAIDAGQPARRRGESDWVHDVCPAD